MENYFAVLLTNRVPPQISDDRPDMRQRALFDMLKAAWTAKVSRYANMLQAAGTRLTLLSAPLSTLGGWLPDAHRALCSVATTILARGLSTVSRTWGILSQRHTALLVMNSALCLMSGLTSDI